MKSLGVLGWWPSLALSAILVAGCAHEPVATQEVFSPLPDRALTPTSRDNPAAPDGSAKASGDSIAVPQGASPDDWALAEVIRAELTKDRRLATAPMEAMVNHGTVTLRGYVPTDKARKRLCERVAGLPGVKAVKDELVLKNTSGAWIGRNRDF